MKFSVVLALVAAATVVSAETNAQRMARGLPPKAPGRRGTPTRVARGSSPSGTSQCNTGSAYCCNSLHTVGGDDDSDDSDLTKLMQLLGVSASDGTSVGMSCSPLSVVGTGSGSSCTQSPVCCDNNSYNGLINIGCSPVSLHL